MKITNRNNLPASLVQAVTNDPYVGGGDYTVTTLIGPPQINILRKLHIDEIEEDVIDRIWALFGQAVHAVLERSNMVGIAERRLYTTIAGKRISGQFDRLVYAPDGVLQDYKVTSSWTQIAGIKPEWDCQLNCLAELCWMNNYPIHKLEIIAIYRDWSRRLALRGGDYPSAPVAVIDIPLWARSKAQQYMLERVILHEEAAHGQVSPCTNSERWYRNEQWA